MIGDEGQDVREDEAHAVAGEEHFPRARFTFDDGHGSDARHVEQDEDHERQGDGLVEVRIISEVSDEARFMSIVPADAVNRTQRGDHDFFSSRAGDEAYADLPVEAERCDDRFYEVTEAGRIGLFQFFSILLIFELRRFVVRIGFGIEERQGLGEDGRILFLKVGKALRVFAHEEVIFCIFRVFDLVFDGAQSSSRVQGVARIGFVFIGFVSGFIGGGDHGFIHLIQGVIVFDSAEAIGLEDVRLFLFHFGCDLIFSGIEILGIIDIHRVSCEEPNQDRGTEDEGTGFLEVQDRAFPHVHEDAFQGRNVIRRHFHDERFLFPFKGRVTEDQGDADGNNDA